MRAILRVAAGAMLLATSMLPSAQARAATADLLAGIGVGQDVRLGADVDSVGGTTPLSGTRSYFISLQNQSMSTTFTTPTITVNSGFTAAQVGASSLPVVITQAGLAPGQRIDNLQLPGFPLCCTQVPVSGFSSGFDSSRAQSPLLIPPGGAQQTVSVTVAVTDSARSASTFALTVAFEASGMGGVTLLSTTTPTNLGQGEILAPGGGPPSSLAGWQVQNPVFQKQYTFTAIVNVPNQGTNAFPFKLPIFLNLVPFASDCTLCPPAGTSITAPVQTLDGPSPNSGKAVYKVDQAATWTVRTNNGGTQVAYAELIPPPADLTANFDHQVTAVLPQGTDSNVAGASLNGHPSWMANLLNNSPGPVANAALRISSGFSPSELIPNGQPQALTSLPYSVAQPSLGSGQGLSAGLQAPTVPVTFTSGFDSNRLVAPTLLPAGGGQQTETLRFMAVDPALAGGLVIVSVLGREVPGATLVSQSGPDNLNQGEQLTLPPLGGLVDWHLSGIVLGKNYVFTAVVNTPNPSGVAQPYSPSAGINAAYSTAVCSQCAGTSQTIAVPTLDGPSPSAGGATFSVAEAGHAWNTTLSQWRLVGYPGQNLGGGGPLQGAGANVSDQLVASQPPGVDSTSAASSLDGSRSWGFNLNNQTTSSLGNPTISVASGFNPAQLVAPGPGGGGPLTSLPFVTTQPTLAPGQGMGSNLNGPQVPVTFAPGYDSSRTVTPRQVPSGGGHQTVAASVTFRDPALAGGSIGVFINAGDPGVTLLTQANPPNLDQGETVGTGPAGGPFANWNLNGAIVGKTYTFTAVINTANPGSSPIDHNVQLGIFGSALNSPICPEGCPQSALTIADPALDGTLAGSGAVTFSVAGGTVWRGFHDTQFSVQYTTQTPQFSNLRLTTPAGADFADSVALSAVLSNQRGRGVAGQIVNIALGDQTCTAITAGDGTAACRVTLTQAPGAYTVTAAFPGSDGLSPSRATAPFAISREEASLAITSSPAIGPGDPVSATLLEDGLAPIVGRSISFSAGGVTVTAITDATGRAAAHLALPPGSYSLVAAFAGDGSYVGATATTSALTVFRPTNFVIWGGEGLTIGHVYEFYGRGWNQQVRTEDQSPDGAFTGFACVVSATGWSSGEPTGRSRHGQGHEEAGESRCRPPNSVSSVISVIVTTALQGDDERLAGNIAGHAVLRLAPCPAPLGDEGRQGDDGSRTAPLYSPDGGAPSCGVLLARTG